MRHAIALILCDRNAKGELSNVYSRGCVLTIYGTECVYVGPSPDRCAYFWVAPGDVRGLNAEQLAEHGYEVLDGQNLKGKPNG